MGLKQLFKLASVVPTLVAGLERAGEDIRALRAELAQLQDDHHRVEQAFNSFRQRVYAWRKGQQDPTEPPSAEPKAAPLDKAAILAAHRSKQ